MKEQNYMVVNHVIHRLKQQERTISQLVQIIAATNKKLTDLQVNMEELKKNDTDV